MTAGDPWVLGYWEYLPDNYESLGPDELLPLLVFLPGIGEFDDDSSCPGGTDVCSAGACGGDGLCRALTWGPQQHMRVGAWDDVARPFIMVSPQNDVPPFSTIEWDMDELDAFFEYIVDNYPVDPRRLYLTGMSQGGRGVLQYVSAHPRRFTAAAPMPGGQTGINAVGCTFQDTALWVFHGEDDNNANLGAGTFSPCGMVGVADMYQRPEVYPQLVCADRTDEPGHPTARLSMFYDVGHFAWQQAIDPVGLGFPASEWLTDQGCGFPAVNYYEYSAANDPDGIYSWFLTLDRPDVAAPDDFDVPGDDDATSITATLTDDDTVTWTWTQLSGPAVTLDDTDQPTVQISGLVELTQYEFEVVVLDADGQWDRDQITINTTAGTGTASASTTGSTDPTDPTTDGGSVTMVTGVTDSDPTTGGGSVSDTDATTGGGSVSDTDATTGVITSDTDATTGFVTSDTDATTGVITSDTDATTGVITSVGTESSGGSEVGSEVGSSEVGSSEVGSEVGSSEGGSTSGGTEGSSSGDSTVSASTTMMTSSDSDTMATTGGPTTDPTDADATAETSGEGGSVSQTGNPTDPTAGSLTDAEGSGTSGDTEPGVFGEDPPSGCGCEIDDDRPALAGAPWALLGVMVALRRRRRRAA